MEENLRVMRDRDDVHGICPSQYRFRIHKDAVLKVLGELRSQNITDVSEPKKFKLLLKYTRNLTKLAKEDKLDPVINRKAELISALQSVKTTEGVALIFLAISDILKINTKLVLASADEVAVAEKAFCGKAIDNVLDIGAKLSRKKDIAPPIETALIN